MSLRRAVRRAACLLLACVAVGCAGRGRQRPAGVSDTATMGVFHASVELASGETRRFRLLLYAELPDRIHGEILSPIGTTELILDGGEGRIAVTLPREKVAYVGAADAKALESVLGVALSLDQLVGALLGQHVELDGHPWSREPPVGSGLPRSLEIAGGAGYRLRLRLKRIRPLRVSTTSLGTGEAPPGVDRLPLDALRPVELPDDPGVGDSG